MKIIGTLVNFYARLPLRPFFMTLKKIYSSYRILDMKIMKWQGIDYRNVLAVRGGIKYILDLSETIGSTLYYRGNFEPLVRRIIEKFVKPDMVVFDIGANIGCHAFYLAKLVGQRGKVIAFEPMLRPFLRIKRNKELNNFNNIILEKIALSNINQKKQLVFFQSSFPFIKKNSPQEETKEKIDFLTLDEYLKRNKIKRIDFIKLDVDGYEYKVLQGGINAIKKFKPVMVAEFGKENLETYGDSLEKLIDFLAALDYSFYSEKNLRQYPNKKSLIKAVPENKGTINILCLPY